MPKTAYEVAYIRALLEEASEELKVSELTNCLAA